MSFFDRSGCAFQGVLRTVSSIRGLIPVVHSNSGCAAQSRLAEIAGGAGGGYISGYDVPSTNMIEKHVIFGGGSRLREQIKNTVKVVGGEVYVILQGCASAMVGDDLRGMTQEAVESGEAAVCCLAAGFHGGARFGYSVAMWNLIDEVSGLRMKDKITSRERSGKKLVNVFGVVPASDIHFVGDLAEARGALQSLGLDVNVFFGPGGGAGELVSAPEASLNVNYSRWGNSVCERMLEKYGIPFVNFPSLPVGYDAVRDQLLAVAERLDIDAGAADGFLKYEKETFDYFLETIREYRDELAGRTIGLAGEESAVFRIGGFLEKYLGAVVETSIITDSAGEPRRVRDAEEITLLLSDACPDMILGSAMESGVAEELGVPLLEIVYPIRGKVIVNASYSGVRGALKLAEDYISAWRKWENSQLSAAAREIRFGKR
jgi:nitrogenase molybdenum-iron protein beta chain